MFDRPRLLPTHEDENVNNNNSTLYQNTPQFTYQQSYQLQHRNLKNYTFLQQIQPPPPPPPLPSSTNTSNYPPPPLPSLPPMSYPTVTYATQSPPDNSTKLNQLLEQCNLIHSRIGKYRVDPLTESERSQIIDQVYYTAETMLASIKELQSEETHDNDINMMDDVSESSMNNNNNRMNDDSQTDEYKMIRQARNLQDANARPKYRRRSKRSMIGQRCHSCNTTETPEWRRGPDGARTLCNACGLHYSKLLRKGSMTVQTHNFALDSPPGIQIPTRIIQYPCPPSQIKNIDDLDDRS
ncbi:hypothetical protein INT47_011021 [Mucor saturninus]|uniref:GATA-type domain-containing protein n=1 Tax=Mucor saturninus TaxID=64648 RepID=A0A8H7V3J9_9FUNG|nr:hypothetical protein INT47_011021 [Mucor saturninus]